MKDLFNYKSSRNPNSASPKNIPWIGSWWAYRDDGLSFSNIPNQSQSPAKKFDDYWNLGNNTEEWEKSEHTCSTFKDDKATYESCTGWWGHCNAWAAAAVKEPEPRKTIVSKSPVTGKSFKLSVADQKAFLTEAYMSSDSLFVGQTDKGTKTHPSWVWNPNHPKAKKNIGWGTTTYDAFWDVTPRAFFLIMTNYVGLGQMGVVIDRFGGDQVWNQPIVGYKIMPLRPRDITEVDDEGKTIYEVLVRMKMFWAEDGVGHTEISSRFDIDQIDNYQSNTEGFDEHLYTQGNNHYTGRELKFYLYLRDKPNVSSDGKSITKAGSIIGDGIWYHQTKEGEQEIRRIARGYSGSTDEVLTYLLDQTHPDFIWLPTNLVPSNGYGNPYITEERVRAMLKPRSSLDSGDVADSSTKYIISITNVSRQFPYLRNLRSDETAIKKYIKRKVKAIFRREGIYTIFGLDKISLKSRNADISIEFKTLISQKTIKAIFNASDIDITIK